MKCEFQHTVTDSHAVHTCRVCGRTVVAPKGATVFAKCQGDKALLVASDSEPRQRQGLGDMVAAGLSAVGITQERVSAIVGRDCGCKKRQEALNRFGRRLGIGSPPKP